MSLKKTVFPYYCGIPRPAGCMASDLLATRFTMIGCILRRQDWPATPFFKCKLGARERRTIFPSCPQIQIIVVYFFTGRKDASGNFFFFEYFTFFFSTTFFLFFRRYQFGVMGNNYRGKSLHVWWRKGKRGKGGRKEKKTRQVKKLSLPSPLNI